MVNRRPSRVQVFVVRLCLCIVLSQAAGGMMMLAQQLIEGIHPLDRWHTACVYGIIGAIAGTIVGMIWGIVAAIDTPPDRVTPPSSNPDAPPD
jgi:drug/metabolite transporter (DMT)-like permease